MPSNCAMPTFEIVAEEPALDSGTPATLPAKERRTRVRRFRALGLTDHARLLLPFLAVGILGGAARLKYPYWWPCTDLVFFVANSFIVTAVLGVLLEMFSARLLVEKVSERLAQRLLARVLPADPQPPIRTTRATT